MDKDIRKTVTLRDGGTAEFFGKGALGRILIGRCSQTGAVITWNLNGRWRWDGQEHDFDIVDGSFSDAR